MPAPAAVSSPHPSIRALQAVVDRTAPSRSRERVRQLTMTVRQLERAVDAGALSEDAGQSVAVLLDAENTDDFLDSAWEGRWRDRPGQGELSYASVSVLRACLKILGEESGVEVLLPRMGQPAPKPTVPPAQQAALYRRLADWAAEEESGWVDAREAVRVMGRVRLLAMVGVVLDTGARASELSGMRLDDLDQDASTVRVVRRPQNASELPARVIGARAGVSETVVTRVLAGDPWPSEASYDKVLSALDELGPGGGREEETCRLREGTSVAVGRWLRVREHLVAPLEGAKTALWVSVQRATGQPVAGLPLMPRGVERAYARGAAQLNVELAGRWDPAVDGPWVPLPTRLEQLRRSVQVGS
jgi:integrase